MKFALSLTHRCNLQCKYCYGGVATPRDMTLDIARQCVDFAFTITPNEELLEFSFFGGEPLLCFERIKQVTEYIRVIQSKHQGAVRLSMTSNGTRLDTETVNFLSDNNIDLCISIDGPASVHNMNRRFSDKSESHTSVMKGLHLALSSLENVQVNAVYSPETLDHMPETLKFFLDERLQAIHFNPNISTTWSPDDLRKIPGIYEELADIYMESFRNGTSVAVNLLDSKMLLFIKGGYAKEDECGMGRSEMAVAPSGNIYPCERFIGNDTEKKFVIGHVGLGFIEPKRCEVTAKHGNCNAQCAECDISNYCMKWCGCTNYKMTGHINRTGPMLCISERAAVLSAKKVFTTLVGEKNEFFFDHLFRYTAGECNEKISI